MSDALVTRDRFGLFVPSAGLHLDARSGPGVVFVSHAHSDHCSRAAKILCTRETAALHRQRQRRNHSHATTLAYGETMQLGEATVSLAPAGHTLGSAMAVVATIKGTIAYTGDFKLRGHPFSPVVTMPKCDTLVMECTFGSPHFRFPPEAEVIGRLCDFIEDAFARGCVPVVLAYAFGKAQDALWHLTSRGYEVAVHPAIGALCDSHEELGYSFPGPGSWRRADGVIDARTVVLTTPSGRAASALRGVKQPRVVHLTGWAMSPRMRNMFRGCDLILPYSGHADFDELVRAARESEASRVYTVHGSSKFAAHLRELGIDAAHLAAHPQHIGVDAQACAPARISGADQLTLALA